jgi:hypothetical protein
MRRFLFLVVVVCTAGAAHAQRNDLWNNPGLSERGIQYGEQQIILRQDMAHCHGAAFDRAREIQDEQKRKALGVELFNRCMTARGWSVRDPARKPAPKAPRETAT